MMSLGSSTAVSRDYHGDSEVLENAATRPRHNGSLSRAGQGRSTGDERATVEVPRLSNRSVCPFEDEMKRLI